MGSRLDALEKGKVDARGEPVNVDVDGVQVLPVLDEKGNEVGDPTPMAPPVHLQRRLTMSEQIQQMIRREVSVRADELGMESFEEAEDFLIDDDLPDPHTPYEAVFDPAPPVKKEVKNGVATIDEGRDEPVGNGSGKSGAVVEDKSKPQSDVQGSGSKAGSPDPNSEK